MNTCARPIFAFALMTTALFATAATGQPAKNAPAAKNSPAETSAHCARLTACITKINALKVGMTRQDVDKVLTSEYGFYGRDAQRFVFPECRAIKVDIHFQTNTPPATSPDDKILAISRPTLDLSPVPF